MKARIDWNDDVLIVDFSRGQSLAIDLEPGGPNPSFFAESTARSRPLTVGGFVGDMNQGGSCNADVIEFSPHSHGTHTECVGHISRQRHHVTAVIDQQPTLMRIITIDTKVLDDELSVPPAALNGLAQFDGGALAIRTLPNDESKKRRNYDTGPRYPVLSAAAMEELSRTRLLHLLLDTPSLDRSDSSTLENHATWWGLDDRIDAGVNDASRRSVTEMIYVPNAVPDGDYWLDLQLPPLASDAVPSRPMIYPLTRQSGS